MNKISFDLLPQVVQELNSKIDNLTILVQSTKPENQQNDIMVIGEAAKFLNLSVATLYGKVSRRDIPYMKRGNRLYFSKGELINYVKLGKVLSEKEVEDDVDSFLSNSKK
ncbi:helix-turn-helix domain-containing protein [Polaribacter sp. 20A6]|uniref:helix-turn-helix domain-containing protein n=1 Tax=Polaribacter sp. 20A6 TaxID=2687289 RepID=UPI0013FDBFCE|nr:helix-turn-helix domain-containing protein [Polaribacter sp. 20A6]